MMGHDKVTGAIPAAIMSIPSRPEFPCPVQRMAK